MITLRHRLLPVLMPALLATSWWACGDEETTDAGVCRTISDCAAEEACVNAQCVAAECQADTDCGEGLVCDNRVCDVPEDGSGDAGDPDAGAGDADGTDLDGSADAADPDISEVDEGSSDVIDLDTVEEVEEEDIDFGPLTWTVDPADGATGVPLDGVVRVTFNQPMAELTLIPGNLDLEPYSGESPYPFVTYDPETYTLTVTPCAAPAATETCEDRLVLQPNTPYTFTLTQFIRSRAGESLERSRVSRFSTAPPVGSEFHAALAQAHAPVIYQQVQQNLYDTFTTIDFDGDTDVTNNLQSVRGPNAGTAYYSVVETNTHFFVTYLFYYPGRRLNDEDLAEHDFANVQLIIRKVDSDPLGRLQAFVTMYNGAYARWALDAGWYDATVTDVSGTIAGRVNSSLLEDDRRLPIYVESQSHDLCPTTAGNGRCAPTGGSSAPFDAGTVGLIYRPGAVAQRIGDAANNALTYNLRPFDQDFWVFRNQVTGAGARFGGTVLYTAPELAPGIIRPGDGARFPSALNSASGGDSFGDLPFSLGRSVAFPSDAGIWFVDPAYYFDEQFEGSGRIGLNYCFNAYLELDTRDETEGCTRSTFTLP
jgi:hypothetical protein